MDVRGLTSSQESRETVFRNDPRHVGYSVVNWAPKPLGAAFASKYYIVKVKNLRENRCNFYHMKKLCMIPNCKSHKVARAFHLQVTCS